MRGFNVVEHDFDDAMPSNILSSVPRVFRVGWMVRCPLVVRRLRRRAGVDLGSAGTCRADLRRLFVI